MARPHPAPSSNAPAHTLTELVLEVFRLNGDLLAAGDELVGDLGLTSARWQVMGAIALSPVPLPVSHIARNMGLTRQSVQRIVDDMRAGGLVRLEPNPHHRRASLVALTDDGLSAYASASVRQERWASDLAAGLPAQGIADAIMMLRTVRQRLDDAADQTTPLAEAAMSDA
ncbi:MarR family winged helix-turn-helix transcriptional regulator [uncultured Mycobacterium sp.]|uniref:MarR family winged helix-turn-helix transcriptional regulator n=1 Tax=uncultured Mycobacterium sp. TaxID=171292 RepID=UPI0035CBD99C